MRAVLVALAALALAACPKKSGSEPPSNGGGGSFDERQACTADADCTVVEIECCDHCNGGTVVGIHKDHAAEVRATYAGRDECGDTVCTDMGCLEEPTAICKQGICGLRIGSAEDVPALPAP